MSTEKFKILRQRFFNEQPRQGEAWALNPAPGDIQRLRVASVVDQLWTLESPYDAVMA